MNDISSKNDDWIEVTAELVHETPKAFLICEGDENIWIPKSQIMDGWKISSGLITFDIPEWLARAKEMI